LTGVSGGEPSRVLRRVLMPALQATSGGQAPPPGACSAVHHTGDISRILVVDETGIASTPRSNPATFTRVFEHIRRLFAATREAKVAGYGPGRFSFNAAGGRCETCEGAGVVTLDVALLPDVHAPCPACDGLRFNRATLRVRYRGLSIADVLAMSVDAAMACFERHPKIRRVLQALHDVGLGYMPLGQPATTLSAGESHRVKLARELARAQGGVATVYLLEAPTAGLHPEDGVRLLSVLQRLVDGGNTVVMVEHRSAALGAADHVLEFVPGVSGPRLAHEGTPEQIADEEDSPTGRVLKVNRG
jgi:excinuclease ABC subunit A